MAECRKLKCRLFGHNWMTFNYFNQETAVCRISHEGVSEPEPAMFELYCTRSGEWVVVDNNKMKNYLTKYPFPEEEEHKQQEGQVIIVGGYE